LEKHQKRAAKRESQDPLDREMQDDLWQASPPNDVQSVNQFPPRQDDLTASIFARSRAGVRRYRGNPQDDALDGLNAVPTLIDKSSLSMSFENGSTLNQPIEQFLSRSPVDVTQAPGSQTFAGEQPSLLERPAVSQTEVMPKLEANDVGLNLRNDWIGFTPSPNASLVGPANATSTPSQIDAILATPVGPAARWNAPANNKVVNPTGSLSVGPASILTAPSLPLDSGKNAAASLPRANLTSPRPAPAPVSVPAGGALGLLPTQP
jgi:hypothetical protein